MDLIIIFSNNDSDDESLNEYINKNGHGRNEMVGVLNRIMEKFLENLKDADTVDRLNSVRINFLSEKVSLML